MNRIKELFSFAQRVVIAKNDELIMKNPPVASEDDLLVKYIRPLFEDNSRLSRKNGLFTKAPTGVDIEQWVKKFYFS